MFKSVEPFGLYVSEHDPLCDLPLDDECHVSPFPDVLDNGVFGHPDLQIDVPVEGACCFD